MLFWGVSYFLDSIYPKCLTCLLVFIKIQTHVWIEKKLSEGLCALPC